MENTAMWGYWKDKRGITDALEADYPELLSKSAQLQQALAMVKNGEMLIDSIMSGLEEDTAPFYRNKNVETHERNF